MASGPSRHRRFELVDGPLPESRPSGPADGLPATSPRSPLVVTICAVLLVVAAIAVPGRAPGGTAPAPGETSNPAGPAAARPSRTCDLADEGCRVIQAERWRHRTAAILRERLDPRDAYFDGYSYSVTPLYNTGPRLNALALEVYRLEGGGTEVFVQIAKTRADAVRCGTVTHRRCTSRQLRDGKRFALTTTTVAEGIEVQHSPTGTYVITLVARNTTAGRPLPLTTGDLIEVAQDPRLRPPPD